MFVAGIVGGVVVGIVSHSDYSDYRDHSQYGDANLVSEIKAKEAQIERFKKEVNTLQKNVNSQIEEVIINLQHDETANELIKSVPKYKLEEWAKSPTTMERNIKELLTKKINSDIEEDKKNIKQIDEMILKINQLQLLSKNEDV